MTNERFNALVGKFEALAKRNPRGYRFRVLMLALLGIAYVAGVLLLITAMFIGALASVLVVKVLALELMLVIAFFIWMMAKALWVNIPPPEGMPIMPFQAPKLFAMINDLRRQLDAPMFHQVLITDDFNADVVQVPYLGIFGWHHNYLLIGLPLMKALTVEQVRALLAHEIGHLAKGQGRASNWIYLQRLCWLRLRAALDANRNKGGILFKPFLNWFAPYFNACSFPLARTIEYEADAISVRLTSARAAAEALTSVSIVGSYLNERFWPQLHKQADELPRPRFSPYSSMSHEVAASLDSSLTRVWLEDALARRTTSDDTHPALADRLTAIGETPRLSPPVSGWAADRLLGTALASVNAAFDRSWHDSVLPIWEEHHRTVQEDRRRLAELDARHRGGHELSPVEAYDRAVLTDSVGNDADSALEQFRLLHLRDPSDSAICFGLGMRLLARNDDAGRALIEHAMASDEDLILAGCEALRDHCWRRGQPEEAHVWHRRLAVRTQLQDAAAEERKRVSVNERLERHQLPGQVIASLRSQLQSIPGLYKVYYVKKSVRHLKHRPCHVLGFAVAGLFHTYDPDRTAAILAEIRSTVHFPGETLVMSIEGENSWLGYRLFWMRGARIL